MAKDAREQGSGPYQCLVCGKIVQSTAGLKHHVTVMHKKVRFVNYGLEQAEKSNVPTPIAPLTYGSKNSSFVQPSGVDFMTSNFHAVPSMYVNGSDGYSTAVGAGFQNTYINFEQGTSIVGSQKSSFSSDVKEKKKGRKRKKKPSAKPVVVPEVTGEPDEDHHVKMMEISTKCPFCGKEFGRPQACGMHKKYCEKNPFKRFANRR